MSDCAFTTFDTTIGRCALVWRGGLLIGASLPEGSEAALLASIQRRFPGAAEDGPPEAIRAALESVVRLLSGEPEQFEAVEVDLRAVSGFERSVLEVTRRIPHGETRTYGSIAATLGATGAARAVGRALGANPLPIIIPCHRVLAANGKSGGFSAPGGSATKLRMLEIEGARRAGAPELFDRLPLAIRPAS